MDNSLKSFLQDSVLAFRAVTRKIIQTNAYQDKHWYYDAEEYTGCFVNDSAGMSVFNYKTVDPSGDPVIKRMQKSILGAGCFSFVVLHPTDPDKIIKFFWKGEDACLDYIKDVFEGNVERTDWMPVVYAVGRTLGIEYAIMERLHELAGVARTNYYVTTQEKLEGMFAEHMGYVATDLHAGNVMVRHDGTLVITDPCA